MKENEYEKYDTVLENVEEKKRYTAVEKAKRTLAMAEMADSKVAEIVGDLRDAVEPIIQMAQKSNNKFVVRKANQIALKLSKILGE